MPESVKISRGRPLGISTLNNPPCFQITEIRIKAGDHCGPYLKKVRAAMGFFGSAVARAMFEDPNKILRYEKADPSIGNSIKLAFKYSEAIGIRKITFIV